MLSIKNIFDEGELPENTTISKMETVVNRGFRGEVSRERANLDNRQEQLREM